MAYDYALHCNTIGTGYRIYIDKLPSSDMCIDKMAKIEFVEQNVDTNQKNWHCGNGRTPYISERNGKIGIVKIWEKLNVTFQNWKFS